MNLTAFHKYNTELLSRATLEDNKNYHSIVLLHLLVLTRMNRWVCKESLKEFLVRFFLILDQPISETFDKLMENEALISGKLGDSIFEFTLEDLVSVTGFARGELKFHVWGTLDEFIRDYQKITYDIWAEESEEGALLGTSEDFFHMTNAMNYDLYEIQNLSLNFRKNLSNVTDSEISEVSEFVDFLIARVSNEFFSDYHSSYQKELNEYDYTFTDKDVLFFNPTTEFFPPRIRKILEHFIPKNDPGLQIYLKSRGSQESITKELLQYLNYIKIGFGVKYGLIRLSDNPDEFQSCFDPRFENGELVSIISYEFGSSTSEIFNRCKMVFWLHLLP